MSPIQSNTQDGVVVKTSASALAGKTGYFAVLNTSGYIDLAGAGAVAQFVIEDEQTGVSGDDVAVRPLTPNRNTRVVAGGTITSGDKIASDASGKAVTATGGKAVLGYAEESASSGGYVLIRPALLGVDAVAETWTQSQSAVTDNSGGSATTTLAVVTAPTAITDSSTGSSSSTLAANTNPDLSAWNGSTDPTATQATAIGASITASKNAISSLATAQAADRAAIVSLTNAVASIAARLAEIKTDIAALKVVLDSEGITKT